MSIIETVNDVNNTFLSRRELTCNFAGLGGKLKKLEAVDMITKEFKLDGKIVIPIKLQNHVGNSTITGTFYVYEDEKLAKEHVNSTIFSRLEKAKKVGEEKKEEKAEKTDEKVEGSKSEKANEDKKVETKDVKTEEKSEEKPKEEKTKEKSE